MRHSRRIAVSEVDDDDDETRPTDVLTWLGQGPCVGCQHSKRIVHRKSFNQRMEKKQKRRSPTITAGP